MAFGDPKGTQLVLTGASVGATNVLTTGSAVVVVGDLVVVCFAQQTALTASGVTDNLGNTYTAANAGTDAGVITGRFFYSRVTAAGTLSSVTVAATSSANDFAGAARAIEGPFDATDLLGSTTPANTTADITTPFVCPLSGTLDSNGGRSKLVVGWTTRDNNVAWASDSPNVEIAEANRANAGLTIGVQVVAGTTSTAPAFSGTNPAAIVLGTIAFNMGVQAHVGEVELFDAVGNLKGQANALLIASSFEVLDGAGSFSVNATKISASAEDIPTWEYTVHIPYRRVLAYESYFQVPFVVPAVAYDGQATFAGSGSFSAHVENIKTGEAIFQGSGSFSALVNQEHRVEVRFNGVGSLSANTVSAAVEDIPTWYQDTFVPYRRVLAYQSYFEVPFAPVTAHSGEARFSGAGSLSVNPLLVGQIQARFAGSGSFSALVQTVKFGEATFQGAGSFSANVLLAGQIQARFAGSGSLSANVDKLAVSGEARFAGAGSFSVYVSQQHVEGAVFAGVGSLSALVRQTYAGNATFAGAGNFSAWTTQAHVVQAIFNGAGSFSAQAVAAGVQTAEAIFAGAGNLSVYVRQRHSIRATLEGAGSLAVNLQQPRIRATFAGAGNLSVNVTQRHVIRATFAGAGSLSADTVQAGQQAANARFAGAGSLEVSTISLGAIQARFNGAGSLSALVLTSKPLVEVTYAGAGSLSVYARQVHQSTASFSGEGSLSARLLQVHASRAIFAGAGSLSVYASNIHVIEARFDGSSDASIDADVILSGAHLGNATFAGQGNLVVLATIRAQRRARSTQAVVTVNQVRPVPAIQTRPEPSLQTRPTHKHRRTA